jgi:predicted SAM-dependent methyltransferase
MREQLVRVATTLQVDGVLRQGVRVSRQLHRRARSVDTRLIDDYLRDVQPRRLHLGCGGNLLEGWLNSDYYPSDPAVLHLDATSRFPVPANQFDYVFSEHVIEHFDYEDGVTMLTEAFRVLKEGGKLRTATPDLQFFIELSGREPTEHEKEYMHWLTGESISYAPFDHPTFLINNVMRNWGHRFIYDETVLRRTLEMIGFIDVKRCRFGESDDEALRAIENPERAPPGMVEIETIVVEATKPRQ